MPILKIQRQGIFGHKPICDSASSLTSNEIRRLFEGAESRKDFSICCYGPKGNHVAFQANQQCSCSGYDRRFASPYWRAVNSRPQGIQPAIGILGRTGRESSSSTTYHLPQGLNYSILQALIQFNRDLHSHLPSKT